MNKTANNNDNKELNDTALDTEQIRDKKGDIDAILENNYTNKITNDSIKTTKINAKVPKNITPSPLLSNSYNSENSLQVFNSTK